MNHLELMSYNYYIAMALPRLSLPFSLLLLSLLVIASAGHYSDASSKYGFDGIPADSPQAKPDEAKIPHYGTKPDYYKPQPTYKDKSEGNENPAGYYTTPYEGEKPEYERKPYVVKPEPKGEEKSYDGTKQEEMNNRISIAVQGLVLCNTGSKYYPIQGASATITCKAVDEVGAERAVSICSKATDAKGYFFATLSDQGRDKLKLKECKAYLKSSPLEACNVPTNVNKAIEGALLSAFRVLKEKKTKLYFVGPFFYTTQAKPAAAPKYGY
ncbi:ATP-dependent RNA helicase DEAH13-like [Gossypium australe]|uniref:ATP-dependent RNA helicase DEAH13-like n=1 Tax=Gossypium australe TaxID=47621 RepID=A0A5B6UQ31_9ROSI|nr:ATP-dependent RNA helicase DEAH13-like [Gossypium australe]